MIINSAHDMTKNDAHFMARSSHNLAYGLGRQLCENFTMVTLPIVKRCAPLHFRNVSLKCKVKSELVQPKLSRLQLRSRVWAWP